jgi:histone H3/H4
MPSRRSSRKRSSLSHSALKRLSLRTGRVRSHSKSVTKLLKEKGKTFLRTVVHDAVAYTEHARKRTVTEKAVQAALERHTGIFSKKILGSPPSRRCESYKTHLRKSKKSRSPKAKSRKSSRLVSLGRRIRYYQNRHDCLHLPKRTVQKVIRRMSADFKNDIRWTSKALNLLQYALELYLESLFGTLGHLSIHRGNKGHVIEKDFHALEALEDMFRQSQTRVLYA